MMGVLKLVLNVHVEDYWLIMIVVSLSYANSVLALRGGRRRRSILVLTTVLLLIGAMVWSFIYHPPSPEKLQGKEPFRHWMNEVALLAAGLWCIDLILRYREQFKSPNRTILRALLIVWMLVSALGSVAAYMLLQFSDLGVEIGVTQLSWDENRLYIVFLLTAVILGWIGLSRVLSSALQLTDALTRDGFLPQWLAAMRAKLRGPFIPLTFFAVVIALGGHQSTGNAADWRGRPHLSLDNGSCHHAPCKTTKQRSANGKRTEAAFASSLSRAGRGNQSVLLMASPP